MKTELLASTIQINMFLSSDTLLADSSSIVKLMPFIEQGYFPNFIEVNSENGIKSKALRVEKEVGSSTLSVSFGPKILNINFDSLHEPSIDEVINSLKDILNLLKKTLSDYVIRSNRVAVVFNQGFKYSDELHNKIFHTYMKGDEIPLEWSFRHAILDRVEDEQIFHVVSSQRGVAVINVKGTVSQGDSILLSVDNNTIHDNIDFRFNLDSEPFLFELIKKTFHDIIAIKG